MMLLPDTSRPAGFPGRRPAGAAAARPGPLMLRFRVKGTGERQTRRVERITLDGRGMLVIEQAASRELLALDRIEELRIDRVCPGPGTAD